MTATARTNTDPVTTSNGVLDMLRRQRSLYTKLESVASRQRSLITSDEPSSLLALLADRQKLSVELRHIAMELEPVRREWDRVRRGFSSDQRDEAETLLGEIRQRLGRIIEGDEQDSKLLSARKQAAAAALRESHTTSEALAAYRAPVGGTERLDCLNEAT
ncbi:MAG: hypothetical protein IIB60_00535 [Planctomycetes bacterium]|nr:hypothetical protein [Planctomycetota bacterium]